MGDNKMTSISLLTIQQKEDKKGFELRFKDRLILQHYVDDPCAILGLHEPNIQMHPRYVGFYKKIKNNVTHIFSLTEYIIEEITQNESYVLKFGEELEIAVNIVDKRLILEPKLLSGSREQWTHFSLKIAANAKEAIYGGGEQFSYLNLRGRNLRLWVQEPGFIKTKKSILKYIIDFLIGAGGEWWTSYYPQATFVSSDNFFVNVESYAYGEIDFRIKRYHQIRFNEIPVKIILDV